MEARCNTIVTMVKKKPAKKRSLRRKNLGVRATVEDHTKLREIAKIQGKSLQGLFTDVIRQVLSGESELETRFLRSLPASAVMKNRAKKIVWVNPGYAAIAGPRESLIGKTIREVWASPTSAKEIEEQDDQIFRLKHATIRVETVLDRWGKKLQRLRFRFPIPGSTGEVQYLGAIGFDIEDVIKLVSKKS